LRDAYFFDSACDSGNYAGDATIIEGDLAGGFHQPWQLDGSHSCHVGQSTVLQLKEFRALALMYQHGKCEDRLLGSSVCALRTVATDTDSRDEREQPADECE
jgi:hypothetical protein